MIRSARLPVGAHGNISYRDLGPKRVRALAHVRDHDGRTRQVTALGTSKAHARARLLDAIAARSGVGGQLTGESTVAAVAVEWIADIARLAAEGQRAPNTERLYRGHLDRHVLPALGELRIRECTTPRLNAFLLALRSRHGAALTKTCRTVLNGVVGHAIRAGALNSNPMRDVARIAGAPAMPARAMTQAERTRWLQALEDDEAAVAHDLPDLTRIMLATGVRIGECLALTFDEVEEDGKALRIDFTLYPVKGRGLVRGPTKTRAGARTLRLPSWAADIVRERGDQLGWSGPLFPAPGRVYSNGTVRFVSGWRDPSNTARALRQASDRAGFGWVTSHVFRKTCATVLDEAGLTAREIADQLGHANITMTQDVYLGRKAVTETAAVALEDMFGGAR